MVNFTFKATEAEGGEPKVIMRVSGFSAGDMDFHLPLGKAKGVRDRLDRRIREAERRFSE